MKSLKHPWALIGIPGPCCRKAALGAAVTWQWGSAARERALCQHWEHVVSHRWRKNGRVFPCPQYLFSHVRHSNFFRDAQEQADVHNLLLSAELGNGETCSGGETAQIYICITRAQCWTSLTLWIWSQCFFWATGRIACLCLYLPRHRSNVPNKRVNFVPFQISHGNKMSREGMPDITTTVSGFVL